MKSFFHFFVLVVDCTFYKSNAMKCSRWNKFLLCLDSNFNESMFHQRGFYKYF